MAQSISTNDYAADVLAAITAAMSVLDGAFVGLLAQPFTATKSTTYADVTTAPYLPTYNTYVQQAVAAWSLPFLDTDGVVKVNGGDLLFAMVNGLITDQIWGWFVADAGQGKVYYVKTFDEPVLLVAPPDGYEVEVIVPLCWGD